METLFPQLAVGDWITMASRKWPDAKCFISPLEDLSDVSNFRFRTFYEANHRVTKLAHALDSLGLTKGDRVAILGVDSIEHMEVILACAKLGVTYCDLNYRLRDGEIANILKRSPVKAIFIDPRYFEVIDRIKESIPPTKHLFSLASSSSFQSIDELIEKETQESEIISRVRGEEILSIMFTSGTTSIPKGVLQSERMMRNIVYSFNREIRIQPGGRQYSGASLFHISYLVE